MSVDTSKATVTTVSVEVKAIRIGAKQMTQAVFNQVVDESPFNYDDTNRRIIGLDGVGWGYVLHQGKWWLIWQKGSELRKWEREFRTTPYKPCDTTVKSVEFALEKITAWYATHVPSVIFIDWYKTPQTLIPFINPDAEAVMNALRGLEMMSGIKWMDAHTIGGDKKAFNYPRGHYFTTDARENIIPQLAKRLEELQAKYAHDMDDYNRRLHNFTFEETCGLKKLPQLFIAV
jgi:hypothetical protein